MFVFKQMQPLLKVLLITAAFAIVVPSMKLFGSAAQGYTVAMTGRSVMDMWFRHWKLPAFLNRLSIYKNWRIPYKTYERGDMRFEYLPVPPPRSVKTAQGFEYGADMYQAIADKLNGNGYDALFFKFCFVDFGDKSVTSEEGANQRFEDMVSLTKKVHALAKGKNMKLLLANSLPSLLPGVHAQKIRLRYNDWVDGYSKAHADVVKIDLFGGLVDSEGRLKKEFSIDLKESESHPNAEAFKVLEKELFSKLEKSAGKGDVP